MSCFGEIIDGCEMDVTGTSYETIDDLVGYCRRVAGSVGRLSLAVFGSRRVEEAVPLADALGVALQLTNILRDIVEDRSLGRVYLPREDAQSVGCAPDLSGPPAEIARLVSLECRRADEWFAEGLQLLSLLDGRGRASVAAMAGIYRRLLARIEGDPMAVTRGRVSLPTWEKAAVAARSLAGGRP
jgi:phytoene synthase